jgi:addiction module HigA family antidote
MSIRMEDLDSTDFGDVIDSAGEFVAATTPGDVLRHEFMEPLGLSANALAVALTVPANRITGILNGTRSLTADTALRLARAFGTTPEFWLNAQTHYDMLQARAALGSKLDDVKRLFAA